MKKFVYGLIFCLVASMSFLPLKQEDKITSMLQKTVLIRCMADGIKTGHGSGTILNSERGEILTNCHVTSGHDLQIVDYFGNCYAAEKVYYSKKYDLSLILVSPDLLPHIGPCEFGNPQTGDFVYAVGTPFTEDLNFSLTYGIISGIRYLPDTSEGVHLQHDAAINGGNSGGPLFDENGHLVGINQATFGSKYIGISIAISSDTMQDFYNEYLSGKLEPVSELSKHVDKIMEWLDGTE